MYNCFEALELIENDGFLYIMVLLGFISILVGMLHDHVKEYRKD